MLIALIAWTLGGEIESIAFLCAGLASAWGLIFLGLCDLYRSCSPGLRICTALTSSLPLLLVLTGGVSNTWETFSRIARRTAWCEAARVEDGRRLELDRLRSSELEKDVELCGSLKFRLGL